MPNPETDHPALSDAPCAPTLSATTTSCSRRRARRSPRTARRHARRHRSPRRGRHRARSTAISRRASTCSRPSTSTRSRRWRRSAADLADLPPWEALDTWLHQFVRYAATKRALAEELLAYIDTDAEVFQACRVARSSTRATCCSSAPRRPGLVRPDANFSDVGRIVAGIAAARGGEPEQIERMLDIVLDGLRYSPR